MRTPALSGWKGWQSVRAYEHPAWCARGHQCGLGEHRARPVILDVGGLGKVTLTRVLARNGRERMELTGSAYLAPTEPEARQQLNHTIRGFAEVVHRAAENAGVAPAA